MRWAQSQATYGNAKWHMTDGEPNEHGVVYAACDIRDSGIGALPISRPKFMAADRRPALARNNVCARCKKAYLKARPDLQGYVDRLNDRRDV